MRLRITLDSLGGTGAIFPLNYNYGLESFIYNHISGKLAKFLHDEGHLLEKRTFKFFTFSRIFGKYKVDFPAETISFNGAIYFHVSSPVNELVEQLAENLLKSPEVKLFKQPFVVSSIEVHPTPAMGDSAIIKMLSPVTVYSTFFSAEGEKKTYYYSPFEDEFSRLIAENLKKKYRALYKELPGSDALVIVPVRVTKQAEKIVKYTPKSSPYTLVKGWMGVYKLEGSPQLIHIGYDAGIGSKNCQGFGMFEVVN